jgi:hypothetical protein
MTGAENDPDATRSAAEPRAAPAREVAFAGVFGAAALLLPSVFHVLQLGRAFMPMYLPLVALAYFVRPSTAALTAALVPLLSAVTTGMPPFYPPVALWMAVELSLMAALIAYLDRRFPRLPVLLGLALVLALGRVVGVLLIYATARVLELPAHVVSAASFVSGWPGLALIMLTVPALATLARKRRAESPQ